MLGIPLLFSQVVRGICCSSVASTATSINPTTSTANLCYSSPRIFNGNLTKLIPYIKSHQGLHVPHFPLPFPKITMHLTCPVLPHLTLESSKASFVTRRISSKSPSTIPEPNTFSISCTLTNFLSTFSRSSAFAVTLTYFLSTSSTNAYKGLPSALG